MLLMIGLALDSAVRLTRLIHKCSRQYIAAGAAPCIIPPELTRSNIWETTLSRRAARPLTEHDATR